MSPNPRPVTLSASRDRGDIGLEKQRWAPPTMLQDQIENRFQEWGGLNLSIPKHILAPFHNTESEGMTLEHTGEGGE